MKSTALNIAHHKINLTKADVARSSSSVRGSFQSEKSRFQSVFISTIEKSQSDIAQNNRIKNSETKDTGDAQPKMSSMNNLLNSSGRNARTVRTGVQSSQATGEHAGSDTRLAGADLSAIEPLRFVPFTTSMAEQSAGVASSTEYLTTKFSRTTDGSCQDADETISTDHDAIADLKGKSSPNVLSQSPMRISADESDQKHDSHSSPDTAHSPELALGLNVPANAMSVAGTLELSDGSIQPNPNVLAGSPGTLIESRFGTTAWGSEVSQKIVWMMRGAEHSATLTLNPPNLGPLQVVVHVQNNIARASFFSNNSEVRLALVEGVPTLREMMLRSGIELGQTQVRESLITSSIRSETVSRIKGQKEGLTTMRESNGSVSGLLSTFA